MLYFSCFTCGEGRTEYEIQRGQLKCSSCGDNKIREASRPDWESWRIRLLHPFVTFKYLRQERKFSNV